MTVIPERFLDTPEALRSQGGVGARPSRIFRQLAIERPDSHLFGAMGAEAYRRQLTVQTHVGGLAHMVMAHAHRRP